MKRSLVFGLMCSMVFAVACGGDDDGGGSIDATAGGPDGGVTVDGGGGPDAGGALCAADFAGCTQFVDLTGEANVVIATTKSFTYDEKCIRITTGQEITIEASGLHPLNAATCSPEDFVDGPVTANGTYIITQPGIYGYYCGNHGGNTGTGMAGAIEVVEAP